MISGIRRTGLRDADDERVTNIAFEEMLRDARIQKLKRRLWFWVTTIAFAFALLENFSRLQF
jgi:hypothetical protein